ncbi:MAG: ATP synthase F1 subunit delta [Patescibacteria group bacterium]
MPKISTNHYAKILYSLLEKTEEIDEVVKIFLKFLRARHVLKKVDKIAADYARYAESREGTKQIEITSARPLGKETLANIKKQFGEKVKIMEKIDQSILGGCVIREKNIIVDVSLKRQTQKLKQNLLKHKITIK